VDRQVASAFSLPDDDAATMIYGVVDGESTGVWMAKVAE